MGKEQELRHPTLDPDADHTETDSLEEAWRFNDDMEPALGPIVTEFEQRKIDMAAFHRGELSLDAVKRLSEQRRMAAGKTAIEWQRETSAEARKART